MYEILFVENSEVSSYLKSSAFFLAECGHDQSGSTRADHSGADTAVREQPSNPGDLRLLQQGT